MRQTLDIGAVIQDTFSVIGRKFSDLAILGLIFVAVPTIVIGMLAAQTIEPVVQSSGMIAFNFSPGLFVANILIGLLPYMLQAAVIHVTVKAMGPGRSDVSGAISVALRYFLPVLIVSILLSIGISIGLLLLVIPGLILMTIWAVTVPALVVDDAGIFGSFGRSASLTEGNRWPIFGLFLLAWVAVIVLGLILSALTFGALSTGLTQSSLASFSIVGALIDGLMGAAFGIVGAVGSCVLYLHLREIEDGTSADAISDVFS
ncbi:hypothetical protein [Henriciella litoralis]|uniref:hypothetical protein n=1 Tax=Henriciella litoralis TaxID=568102 RepID=UPI000A0464EA|nr:hypothetical protein [Henriciella litoralis]